MNDLLQNWRTTAFGLAKFIGVVLFVVVKTKYDLTFSVEDVAIIGFALGSAGSSVVAADAKPAAK